jgi:PAS domain S-box-containing protein
MDQLTLKALFEHSSLGIIISNEEGVIEKSNPCASKFFGYELDELNGQKIEILIPAHLKHKHVGYRQEYNKNPHPRSMGSNLNLLAVKKNGDQFPVEISLTSFESQGYRKIVSFVNDITVRKRAENDLKRLTEELEFKVEERTKELSDALLELSHTNEGLNQEMERRKQVEAKILSMLEKEKELSELKSRFVSMASHEFRTPLAGILTSVSLIAKYTKTEEETKRNKHVQIIKSSVRNLANILNDFLSLDKLDQNKVASNPIKFDFIQFIEDMAEEFRDPNDRQNIFEIKHKDREIILFQDKDMIRNILINLVSNAIKYSAELSTITITTQVKDSNVVLEIQDRGMGIPKEDQKHLFETFFRANNVSYLQGTGLGLNIVKRYLDLMGGKIEFTSIENEGTTFKVILPLEKP